MTLSDLTDIESLGLDGFVDLAIASEIGYYGTFTVAFPIGWRIWVVGEDPAQFVAVVEEKDPSYSRALNDMMEQSNADYEAGSGLGPLLRAAFVDARPDHLVQVMVRLSNGADDLESLRQLTQDQYEAVGATILRLEVYPSEGGGSVESTALIPLGTELEPRVQHQRLVVDQTNLRTWGLVCNIHESGNADSSDECWTLLRSISPRGYLIGP